MGLVKGIMQTKADDIHQCIDMLLTEPKPDADEPHADKDMCSGKANGKGKPVRVPQVGEENGPKWIRAGWVEGYKIWVGDLPLANTARGTSTSPCKGARRCQAWPMPSSPSLIWPWPARPLNNWPWSNLTMARGTGFGQT